jgi:hypothetical protein
MERTRRPPARAVDPEDECNVRCGSTERNRSRGSALRAGGTWLTEVEVTAQEGRSCVKTVVAAMRASVLQRGMRPSDLNTRGTNGQIDISLDERVKAVSRSQIRDFGILNDRFAPMRIKAYRDAHSRRGCKRAISATRKSLKSQAAQNVKSPLVQCSCRHLEVV